MRIVVIRVLVVAWAAALTLLGCQSEAAAEWNTNDGAAVAAGYDVVAYHVQGRAVRGSERHAHSYRGGTFWFSSEANRARFAATPERYAPAYGGYCAFAMAQGRRARIDPQAWSIVGGRFYLNYSLDVRRRWNERQAEYIERADEAWPRVRTEP